MNHLGPYLLVSGRYKGQYLEELILKNPQYIRILDNYRQVGKKENQLQKHLHLLLESRPQTKIVCPFCQKRSIKYFLFLNSEEILPKLCCCESAACREQLKLNHPNDYLLPIKFGSVLVFKGKTLQNKALRLIKMATGLNRQTNADEIFKIFIGEPLKRI